MDVKDGRVLDFSLCGRNSGTIKPLPRTADDEHGRSVEGAVERPPLSRMSKSLRCHGGPGTESAGRRDAVLGG